MFLPFELIESGLGVPIESVLLIVLVLGGLLFAAKSFQLTLIYYLVSSCGLFLLLYTWSLSDPSIYWVPSLTFMLMSLGIISLSLIFVKKQEVSVV